MAYLPTSSVFVIPKRYIQENPSLVQFHAASGKVRYGETPHAALIREIAEEIQCSATIKNAERTLVMSSRSDIGELSLENRPVPSYVYKRIRSNPVNQSQSISWLLGYEVLLAPETSPQPRNEIAALLSLSKQMLDESVSRRLRVGEIMSACDGSKIVVAEGVTISPDAVLTPTGLASILASI